MLYYCNVINNEITAGPRDLPTSLINHTEQELIALGWYRAIFVNLPHMLVCDPVTEVLTLDMTIVNTIVECRYVVTRKSDELVAATQQSLINIVRDERNVKLAQCDWTQLSDNMLTNEQKLAWQTYRQQLRDFLSIVNLSDIVWPTPPTN